MLLILIFHRPSHKTSAILLLLKSVPLVVKLNYLMRYLSLSFFLFIIILSQTRGTFSLFNHLPHLKYFFTHIPSLLSVAGTLSKERGGEELHWDRLLRHAHSQCASSQCAGEPPVVHTVHTVPTRNRSGTRQHRKERKERERGEEIEICQCNLEDKQTNKNTKFVLVSD